MDARMLFDRLGGGHASDEFKAAFVRVAEAVIASANEKATGKVTLTVTLSKGSINEPLIVAAEEIGMSLPKTSPRGAYYFIHEGDAHAKDPRQQEMTLREVDSNTGEIRDTPAVAESVRKA